MLSATVLPLATALLAGFSHALEADHLAAVTTFVSRRPRPLEALGFGVRWAVGHSLAILAVGGALLATGLTFPAGAAAALEAGVGALLIALGIWLLHGVSGGDAECEPEPSGGHRHRRAPTLVGVAHGLAGSAALLALIPVTMAASPWRAGGYLFAFGAGTVLAMGLYAVLAAFVFRSAGARVPQAARALRSLVALVSIGIGMIWVAGALA